MEMNTKLINYIMKEWNQRYLTYKGGGNIGKFVPEKYQKLEKVSNSILAQ